MAGLNRRRHRMARNPPAVKLDRGTSVPVGPLVPLRPNFLSLVSFFLSCYEPSYAVVWEV
jgi:hypothetical protein